MCRITVDNVNDYDEKKRRYKKISFELEYEEMIEILASIRDTPFKGNECFEAAKDKAAYIMKHMPTSDY